jgi:two-component system, OmpR family, sensor kinase
MDGLKERLNESLQRKLSLTLSAAVLVVALIAGAFSFVSAYDEAYELQDDVLRQVASLMDRQHLPSDPRADNSWSKEGNEDSRVIVQRLGDERRSSSGVDEGGLLPLPKSLPDGIQTLSAGGETFRVLVRSVASGGQIAVAQEISFRNQIARASALRTVMPFLILVPILFVIIPDLVRRMFRPLAALAAEIDQRAEQELHPIEDKHLPSEVRPFVVAINRLLARIGQSMESQRRFVADAAHELRTPMAALSLQAELLGDAKMSDLARERLSVLSAGVERGRNLLNQLLTLARTQAFSEPPQAAISIQSIYRRVLEDLLPMATAKEIDLGVEGREDASVWANELDLFTMIRNLVDNAIRYTPNHGRIDLSVRLKEDQAMLQIKDSGPGIPAGDRERVFDPFYHSLGGNHEGSGLGLSIVRTISDRMGARIELAHSNAASESGLCVSVLIPRDLIRGSVHREQPSRSLV